MGRQRASVVALFYVITYGLFPDFKRSSKRAGKQPRGAAD